jgi:hypothetical protein
MYVNIKMIAVETIPGMGEGIKETGGGGKFKYIWYIVLPPSTTI